MYRKMSSNESILAGYIDEHSTAIACIRETCLNASFANNSDNNTTWPYEDFCDIRILTPDYLLTRPFLMGYTIILVYTAIFFLALFGNGLVFLVVHTNPDMKTVTNFFIMNLAAGDILLTLLCVPFTLLSMVLIRYWPFGMVMCKLVNYSQAISVFVSAYTMLAISVDRYMVIIHPLRPRIGMTTAKLVVIAVWIGALVTAAPIFVKSKIVQTSLWHRQCQVYACMEMWSDRDEMARYTYTLLGLQFVIPLLVLIFTYAHIAYVVWSEKPPGEAESSRDSRLQLSKKRMVVMMVTVVIAFIVCWLPLNIFILFWESYREDESWAAWQATPFLWLGSHWLAMSHACTNPFIYCYMNAKYRSGFREILVIGVLCCRGGEGKPRWFNHASACEDGAQTEMVATTVFNVNRRSTAVRCRHTTRTHPCPQNMDQSGRKYSNTL